MKTFNYANIEKFQKMAGKTKAAVAVVEAMYNNNGLPVRFTKAREIDIACRLAYNYPEFFTCNRVDYSGDHILTIKA